MRLCRKNRFVCSELSFCSLRTAVLEGAVTDRSRPVGHLTRRKLAVRATRPPRSVSLLQRPIAQPYTPGGTLIEALIRVIEYRAGEKNKKSARNARDLFPAFIGCLVIASWRLPVHFSAGGCVYLKRLSLKRVELLLLRLLRLLLFFYI